MVVGVVGAADLLWNSTHCFGHGLYFLLHVSRWACRCYRHSQLISIAVQTDTIFSIRVPAAFWRFVCVRQVSVACSQDGVNWLV